ncbi:hypothetical protein OQA88_13204 [Cercophora sp. LCS_1]
MAYLLFALAISAAYITSCFVSWYRLRHFAGPTLGRFSYAWMMKTALSGRAWQIHMETKEKYGDALIRIGPDVLITDDPAIIRRMNAARSPYKRDKWYNSFRSDPHVHSMFTTDDDELHNDIKSKTAAAYSGKDVPTLEADIDGQLLCFKDLIRRKYLSTAGDTKPMDLGRTAQYLTIDSITKLAFGRQWGCLATDSDVNKFIQTVEDVAAFYVLCCDVPWMRRIFLNDLTLMIIGPKDTDPEGMGANEQSRQESGHRTGSFIRHGLSRRHCEAEVPLAVAAGSDTTAGIIRGTMLYILTTPHVYRRLQDEIDEAIASSRASSPVVSHAEAKKLPYLQDSHHVLQKAVIYEGLRIHPPNHILASKLVPPEGDTLDGKLVPGGTKIAWNVWSLLRRKDVFGQDASVFRPERWLEAGADIRIEMERHVELIFGYGRYGCAGKTIALLELNKVFFELLRDFNFQILNPKAPWNERQYSVFFIRDMWVRVSDRREDRPSA